MEALYTEGGLKLEVLVRDLRPKDTNAEEAATTPELKHRSATKSDNEGRTAMLKSLAMPVVKYFLYDALKIGINIIAFSRKR